MENRLAVSKGEAHTVKHEGARSQRQIPSTGLVARCLRGIKDVEDPLRGGDVELNLGDKLGDPLHRIPELASVVDEDQKGAYRHPAYHRYNKPIPIDKIASVSKDDGGADCEDGVPSQRVELLLPGKSQGRLVAGVHRSFVAAKLVVLPTERLSEAESRQRLLGQD